jgi:uncharacterized protein
LQIRLESARFEPVRWEEDLTFSPGELGLEPGGGLGPVAVRGTLSPVASSYLLDARLSFRVTLACDRCTAPAASEVEARVLLNVIPVGARSRRQEGGARGEQLASGEGGQVELSADDVGTLEVADDRLDTRPLIAEQVVLELPTRPLCRTDCAGLCPRCGADLNLGECRCGPAAGDPRWSALEALRNRLADRD